MSAVSITNNSIINNISQPINKQETWKEKIQNIAKKIFSAILTAALLIANPTIFVACIFTGILWSGATKAIEKITNIWKKQPWTTTAMIIGAGILALPATLAACSGLYALHLGSQMA